MKSVRILFSVVLILGAASLACNASLDQTQNEPEIESVSPAGETSPGIELPPDKDQPELEIANLDHAVLWDPDQLSSYRADYVITFDGFSNGEGIQGTMSLLMEATSDPLAQHFFMDLEGYDIGDESISNTEVYFINDTLYANLGIEEGWISFPGASFEDMQDTLFRPEDILDLPPTASRSLLPETVNGVSSWHYMIDEENLQFDSTEYDTMKADAWVAVDGGYLVRMDATVSGSFLDDGGEGSFLDEGTAQFIFNLLDVNQGFSIALPPAALEATDFGLDGLFDGGEWEREDIPLPDDAEIGFSDLSMVEATTTLSVIDARDLMLDQLSTNEWMLDGDPYGDTDSYFANFYKGDEFLSMAITLDGQGTSIFISLE